MVEYHCWVPSPVLTPPVLLHAAAGTAEGLPLQWGTDRPGQGSSDTSLGPWPHAWEAQREQGMPEADSVDAAGSTCMLWPGSCRVPSLPYMSWRKGGPQLVETEMRNILETVSRELGRLPLFCYFFLFFFFSCLFSHLFSPPHSIPPCFLTARFPLAWATSDAQAEQRHHFPRVSPAAGGRSPGPVTPNWAKEGQSKVTLALQTQSRSLVQMPCNLGLRFCVIISISPTVRKNNNKQPPFLAAFIFFWAGSNCNCSKAHCLAKFGEDFVIDGKRHVPDRKNVIYFKVRHCSDGVF